MTKTGGNSRKASLWRLFKSYQLRARQKKLKWELTLDEFEAITSMTCCYCSKPPVQQSRAYMYNGIDRKDNKLGYTLENSISCCSICNRLKGAELTYEEMQAVASALSKLRRTFHWA